MTVLFLAALNLEARIVSRRLTDAAPEVSLHPAAVRGAFRGRPVVVVTTGVGPFNAAKAAETVIPAMQPGSVVSFGLAGGLSPRLRTGDVVLATEILGSRSSFFPSPPLFAAAIAGLERSSLKAVLGPVLTVTRPLGNPADKDDAHRRYGALAVEMEGVAIARVSARFGVGFLSVRGVSDDAAMSIPSHTAGLFNPLRIARHMALAAGIYRASANLGRALDAFVADLPGPDGASAATRSEGSASG